MLVMIVSLFFIPSFNYELTTEDNYFAVYLDSEFMGYLGSEEEVNECLLSARKQVNSESEELTLLDIEPRTESSRVNYGRVDSKTSVTSRMSAYMRSNKITSLIKAYEVKINSYTVVLESPEDVVTLVQEVADKYDQLG